MNNTFSNIFWFLGRYVLEFSSFCDTQCSVWRASTEDCFYILLRAFHRFWVLLLINVGGQSSKTRLVSFFRTKKKWTTNHVRTDFDNTRENQWNPENHSRLFWKYARANRDTKDVKRRCVSYKNFSIKRMFSKPVQCLITMEYKHCATKLNSKGRPIHHPYSRHFASNEYYFFESFKRMIQEKRFGLNDKDFRKPLSETLGRKQLWSFILLFTATWLQPSETTPLILNVSYREEHQSDTRAEFKINNLQHFSDESPNKRIQVQVHMQLLRGKLCHIRIREHWPVGCELYVLSYTVGQLRNRVELCIKKKNISFLFHLSPKSDYFKSFNRLNSYSWKAHLRGTSSKSLVVRLTENLVACSVFVGVKYVFLSKKFSR